MSVEMASPLFKAFGGQPQDPLMGSFQQFMTQMRGKDPNAILNELVSSGRINQQQLNAVQQQAQGIASRLNSMKGMFGFK